MKTVDNEIDRIRKQRDEARAKLAKLCLAIDPSSKHGPDVEGIIAHFNENIVRRDAKLAELQAELNKRTLTALNATADLKDVIKRTANERYAALAECAEMRDALEHLVIHFNEFHNDWRKGDFKLPKLAECDMESVEAQIPKAQRALSTNCGKGWKSPEQIREVLQPVVKMLWGWRLAVFAGGYVETAEEMKQEHARLEKLMED